MLHVYSLSVHGSIYIMTFSITVKNKMVVFGPIISTILLGTLIYILFIGVRFLVNFRRMRNFFDSLPGYKSQQKHWLRGHLHIYAEEDSISTDQIHSLVKTYPKYYCVWFGPLKPVVNLVHPDTIKVLLKTAEPKPVGFGGNYRAIMPWIGDGLLTSGGQKWARSRRLLTPAFHFEILKPYQAVYNQCTDILLGIIDKYADTGESFELFQLISNCALDIILQCAFSYHTDCQKDRLQHPYCKAVTEAAKLTAGRIRSPLMAFDFLFYSSTNGKKFRTVCDYIHHVADEVIENRKEALETGKEERKKYLDFLDILLSAKDENGIGMTKTDIRAEVDTFMFEGHDTTTSGISWILYELAKNQQYQKECQAEIDEVMKDNPGFVAWDNLSRFEFLSQCLKEGMRLHPPVPIVSRQITRELTIDGTTLPAGTTVSTNIYGVHHNPVVWKDPLNYDPSRFSKDNDTTRDSFAFVPFAAGPRNCIGQHFAMNEEKTVISRILERFTLEVDPQHTIKEQLTLIMRAKNEIRCMAKRRK